MRKQDQPVEQVSCSPEQEMGSPFRPLAQHGVVRGTSYFHAIVGLATVAIARPATGTGSRAGTGEAVTNLRYLRLARPFV
jgi:hypothetical protein